MLLAPISPAPSCGSRARTMKALISIDEKDTKLTERKHTFLFEALSTISVERTPYTYISTYIYF